MHIKTVKEYNPEIGWNIFIEDLSEEDLDLIRNVLLQLPLKRDNDKEKLLPVVPTEEGDLVLVKEVYTSEHSLFDFTFIPERKLFSSVWKSSKMDGHEFIDFLKHNL